MWVNDMIFQCVLMCGEKNSCGIIIPCGIIFVILTILGNIQGNNFKTNGLICNSAWTNGPTLGFFENFTRKQHDYHPQL